MASPRRRDDRPTFAAKSPHFFKIIAADHTTEIDKLKIPRKFVKMYGNALSNLVFLKVPSGQVWQIDIMRNDGEVWLQNGWKQFAEYYSLKYGSLVVFRYEGNSNFFVVIFDMSASEIDYIPVNIPSEVLNTAAKMEECDEQDDVSIEILDEFSPYTRSHKRRRPNSTSETENGANLHPSASHFNTKETHSLRVKHEKSKSKLCPSKRGFEECGGKSTGHRLLQSEIPGCLKIVTSNEKARAHPSFSVVMRPSYIHGSKVKRRRTNSTSKTDSGANQQPSASHVNMESSRSKGMKLEKSKRKLYQSKRDFPGGGMSTGHQRPESQVHGSMKRFTSNEKPSYASKMKNPFFEVGMQPSYVHKQFQLSIPRKYSKRYFTKKNGDVILSVADGRTWSAKYSFNLDNKRRGAVLYRGWKAFVKDNSLKVGDVCVFELLESTKISPKVVTFRVITRDAKCPLSQAQKSAAHRAEPKRSMFQEPKMEASEDDISSGKGKPEQLTRKESGTRRRQHSSSSTPAAPEIVGEKQPSFEAVITPGYLQGGTLNVRNRFVKRFTEESAITVKLQDADGLWPVNLHSYPNKSSKFCGGFAAFLRENSVQVGDTCVFELIDRAGSIINVSILRHGG